MTPSDPQRQELFQARDLAAVQLFPRDAAALQQLFDDNPDYFLLVSGTPARPDSARAQLAGDVPEEFSYTRQIALGFFDQAGHLVGMADVVADLLAQGIWHIGLFMLASERRGQGLGTALYQALQRWIEDAGARWIRLGVVIGNHAAERFWNAQGFKEIMLRHGVRIDSKLNDVRVMVKPLGDNHLSEYRALVRRDQPTDE